MGSWFSLSAGKWQAEGTYLSNERRKEKGYAYTHINDYDEKERAAEEEGEEEGEIIMQFQGGKRDQQIATIRQPNKKKKQTREKRNERISTRHV